MDAGAPLRLPAGVTLHGSGMARRLTLSLLDSVPGLAHAFTVRGSDPAEALREAAGAPLLLRTLRQVHGAVVHRVDREDAGALPGGSRRAAAEGTPEGDALISARRGEALGVWVADCVPILVCDPRTSALAAVHAGWRGTVAGVLEKTIASLVGDAGSRPADLRVAFGPAIGPCCFEVGEEVVEALLRYDPGAAAVVLRRGRPRIDLIEANRRQAVGAGVPPGQVQAVALCTACRSDLLESYRRGKGRAGRMAGMIAWRP